MTLPANWTAGQQFTASAENNVEAAVNALTNAAPAYGTYASRPAAGNAGKLYCATDNNVLYQDNGSSWVKTAIEGSSCSAMGNVPTTGWTAVNMQSGASFAASNDDMLFTIPSVGTSALLQYQYRTYPTPPFTLTAYLDFNFANVGALSTATGTFSIAGLVVSDGTKLMHFGGFWADAASANRLAAGWNFGITEWTNTATYSAAVNTAAIPASYIGGYPKWWSVADDGTNLTWKYSVNGVDWATVASASRTVFLGTPSRIGVVGSNYTGDSVRMRVRSWNGVA